VNIFRSLILVRFHKQMEEERQHQNKKPQIIPGPEEPSSERMKGSSKLGSRHAGQEERMGLPSWAVGTGREKLGRGEGRSNGMNDY